MAYTFLPISGSFTPLGPVTLYPNVLRALARLFVPVL